MNSLFNQLKKILSQINDPVDIETILAQSKIEKGGLATHPATNMYWGNIITQAAETGQLKTLIDGTLEYLEGGFPALKKFKESYPSAIDGKDFLRYEVVERQKELWNALDKSGSLLETLQSLNTGIYWDTTEGRKTLPVKDETGVEIYSWPWNASTPRPLYGKGQPESGTRPGSSSTSRLPFVGTASLAIDDRDVFWGFRDEAHDLSRQIFNKYVNLTSLKHNVILSGPRTGKTSLINAGLVPEILNDLGQCLVISIQKYDDLQRRIRDAVNRLPAGNSPPPYSEGPLPERPVVVILDQFESIYEILDENSRRDFFHELKGVIESGIPIVVACPQSQCLAGAQVNGKPLFGTDRIETWDKLLDCDEEKAKKIIRELLDRSGAVYANDLVYRVVNDCSRLGDNSENFDLQLLQVVCRHLFRRAEKTKAGLDEKLYEKEEGAGGIVLNYLNKTIENQFDHPANKAAWRILAYLKEEKSFDELKQVWSVEGENAPSLTDDELRNILSEMADAKLVVRSRTDGAVGYRTVLKFYADEAARMLDPRTYGAFLASREFQNAWDKWRFQKVLAPGPQLREFERFREKLEPVPAPEQLLFLARSAVETGEPSELWFEELGNYEGGKGLDLIRNLQKVDPAFHHKVNPSFKDFGAAVELFISASDGPAGPNGKTGEWLTRAAIGSEDPKVRQTAALAVTVEWLTRTAVPSEDPPASAETVENPEPDLRKHIDSLPGEGRWQKIKRRAELTGTLLNGLLDEQVDKLSIRWTDRFISWFWRVSERIERSNVSISKFLIHSGLLAGIIIGPLLAIVKDDRNDKNIDGYGGTALLGAGLGGLFTVFVALAMVFTEFSRLNGPGKRERPEEAKSRSFLRLRPDLMVISAGAAAFALINALLNYRQWGGFAATGAWIILGMAAGVGIGLGLKVRALYPKAHQTAGLITGGVVTFALFSMVQFFYGSINPDLVLIVPVANSGMVLAGSGPQTIVAGLTGLAFYLGIAYGTSKARQLGTSYKFILE